MFRNIVSSVNIFWTTQTKCCTCLVHKAPEKVAICRDASINISVKLSALLTEYLSAALSHGCPSDADELHGRSTSASDVFCRPVFLFGTAQPVS
jgi:hypothetical protein